MSTDNRRRYTAYPNASYDPNATRVENYVRCAVCGFAGIDAERTAHPDRAPVTVHASGTIYTPPAGTPIEDLPTVVDRKVYTTIASHGACPFCGTPNWDFAHEPDLLW